MQRIEQEGSDLIRQDEEIEKRAKELLESVDSISIEEKYMAKLVEIGKRENSESTPKEEVVLIAESIVKEILTVEALNDQDEELEQFGHTPPTPIQTLKALEAIRTHQFTEDEILEYFYFERSLLTYGGPDIVKNNSDETIRDIVHGINLILDNIKPDSSMIFKKGRDCNVKRAHEFISSQNNN